MATMSKPEIGTTYMTAETNPIHSRFTCTKCEDAGVKHIIELPEGTLFPKCKEFEEPVTWRLESYM